MGWAQVPLIAHGEPGRVILGKESVPVLTLVKDIQRCIEGRRALRHIHFDSCSALVGIQHADLVREGIQGITITGFTEDIEVPAAQTLGQKLISTLSSAVEGTPTEEWKRSGLSTKVLERAKLLLQGEVGQGSRNGGRSMEAHHLRALKIVGN